MLLNVGNCAGAILPSETTPAPGACMLYLMTAREETDFPSEIAAFLAANTALNLQPLALTGGEGILPHLATGTGLDVDFSLLPGYDPEHPEEVLFTVGRRAFLFFAPQNAVPLLAGRENLLLFGSANRSGRLTLRAGNVPLCVLPSSFFPMLATCAPMALPVKPTESAAGEVALAENETALLAGVQCGNNVPYAIAQCLSAVLTLYVLTTTDGPYRICWKKLCMDWSLLYRIVCVGLPAAIQQMVTSVSNVFVQSYINVFGSDVMAGWSACMKIDQFMMLPMMSVGLASTTFTGQNVGASYIDRAKKGATTAFLLAELVTIVMMIPLLIFAPQMVYLFNQEAAVIRYGTLFLYLLSPFYILCCVNQVYSNVLRGAGDTRTPMIVMLGSFVVFRQIYLFVMSHIFDSIIPIALGYPAGWLVCSVLIYACYRKFRWNKGMRKN